MRRVQLICLTAALGLSAVQAQDMAKEVEMKIVVVGDGADGETFQWENSDPSLDLDTLAIGETRTIESDDGRIVNVTRREQGLEFDVAGETVIVPEMHQVGTIAARIHGQESDIALDVMDDVQIVQADGPAGVTIISDEPLDDSVRESIRSVLISAGRDDEVRFLDGRGDHRRVEIIRKKVEVVQ